MAEQYFQFQRFSMVGVYSGAMMTCKQHVTTGHMSCAQLVFSIDKTTSIFRHCFLVWDCHRHSAWS